MTLYSAARLIRALLLVALATIALVPERLRLAWTGDRPRWQRELGAKVASLCESLGPAAVKAAQIAGSRGDMLPAPFVAALAKVHDRVRPPSRRSINRALRQAYGPPEHWPFVLLSHAPVAAGSIAIVMAAKALDGEMLALKLTRPGIEQRIVADLAVIDLILRMAVQHNTLAELPIAEAFASIRPLVEAQTDMRGEARSRDRLVPALGPFVRVPNVRWEITTRTSLAMEYAREQHRLDDPALPQVVYEAASVRLLQALYRMIFVTGFIHCDLHPGNIACSTNGEMVVYDFGLVAELSDRDRQNLTGLFAALIDGNAERAAHCILASAGAVPLSLDFCHLVRDTGEILSRWSGKPAGAFLVSAFVRDLFDIQQRHKIIGCPGFIAAIWALATFEGLVRGRFPQLDFQALVRPLIVSGLLKSLRRQTAYRQTPPRNA